MIELSQTRFHRSELKSFKLELGLGVLIHHLVLVLMIELVVLMINPLSVSILGHLLLEFSGA